MRNAASTLSEISELFVVGPEVVNEPTLWLSDVGVGRAGTNGVARPCTNYSLPKGRAIRRGTVQPIRRYCE